MNTLNCKHFFEKMKDQIEIQNKSIKSCSDCNMKNESHKIICIECKEAFCQNKHFQNHKNKRDHIIAFDTKFEEFFCFECFDYIIFLNDEDKIKVMKKNKLEYKNKRKYIIEERYVDFKKKNIKGKN
jgi:hypothetical protein